MPEIKSHHMGTLEAPPRMHRTQAHSERLAGTLASLFSSPDISWFKGRQPISAWDRAMVSTDGRVLLIEQAQLSDAGSYRCVASNVVGSTELQYSLRVNGELLRTKGICPQSCCSSVCPCLFLHLSSIHPSLLPSTTHPSSIHPSFLSSIHHPFTHQSSMHPCFISFIFPSSHLSFIHPSIHLSILPSTHGNTQLSIH